MPCIAVSNMSHRRCVAPCARALRPRAFPQSSAVFRHQARHKLGVAGAPAHGRTRRCLIGALTPPCTSLIMHSRMAHTPPQCVRACTLSLPYLTPWMRRDGYLLELAMPGVDFACPFPAAQLSVLKRLRRLDLSNSRISGKCAPSPGSCAPRCGCPPLVCCGYSGESRLC